MGSKFKNRIERLEAQRDAPRSGVIFHCLDGSYELHGDKYGAFEDIPPGTYALVPEQLTIEEWTQGSGDNAMRQQWEI